MKLKEILKSELNEMAELANPDEVLKYIKKGNFEKAAEISVGKTNNKPLKSVAGNIKDKLSPEEIEKYRQAMLNIRPYEGQGKNSPKEKSTKLKEKKLKNAILYNKNYHSSVHDQKYILQDLESKLKEEINQINNDDSLTPEEKKMEREPLDLLMTVVQMRKEGKPFSLNNKLSPEEEKKMVERSVIIAKRKLKQTNPELFKKIENFKEKVLKKEWEEYKKASEEFEKEQKETPESAFKKAVKSGALTVKSKPNKKDFASEKILGKFYKDLVKNIK